MSDMIDAGTLEMPFLADLPKREKSRLQAAWEIVEEIKRLSAEQGALVPPGLAATCLGVSHQRVWELCNLGTLQRVEIAGHGYVTEDSLLAFAKSERKAGRPPKVPSNKELLKAAVEHGREFKQRLEKL